MPLTELVPEAEALLRKVYWAAVHPVISQPTLKWMFILSTLVIVYAFFLATQPQARSSFRAFFRFAFPREVIAHPSAIVDYKFYVVNQLVLTYLRLGQWVVGLAAILQVAEGVQWLLDAAFGATPAGTRPGVLAIIAFTLLSAMAYDYGRFLSHFVQHRVPLLWEFHKVHHSAEVLTPISSYGALTFLFYLTAHLRHSHVPLGYGRLSAVFVSPVMHQLHHSAAPEHFDKNFGFIFSFWDRMAGTWLVPERNVSFTLGLPPDAGKYGTVTQLLLYPFAGAARLLFRPKALPRAEP
jgi:sterol desaturase/sphingolipid hydroxylase (fatty acid hydroxylase superfamily)